MSMEAHKTDIPWPELPVGPARLLVIGLGPGQVGAIPLGAWHALHVTERVILRTERHPCVDELRKTVRFTTCDDLYEEHDRFEDVYEAIVARVLASAKQGPTVYAVPGHPWVGEATTPLLARAVESRNMSMQVIGGASFVEAAFASVDVDAMDGSQIMDGMLLAQRYHPHIDVHLPALIGQLYSRQVASDVKLTLLNAFPPEHRVTLIQGAGTEIQRTKTIALSEVDRGDRFDHLTSLYVPPHHHGSLLALQEITAHLRAPEGCPWDQEQTLESMRGYLLDEVSEVMEAIDAGDDAHTAEELGDVLGIVCMIAQIATEEGRFQLVDAVRACVDKLIRRHPHVFGEAKVESMEALYDQWDAIKARERVAEGRPQKGPLELPASLPALEKARQMQSRLERAGLLQPSDLSGPRAELASLLPEDSDEQVLGQLLWDLVALSRQRGLHAENALRAFVVNFRRNRE